jgi:hypothetical protein
MELHFPPEGFARTAQAVRAFYFLIASFTLA